MTQAIIKHMEYMKAIPQKAIDVQGIIAPNIEFKKPYKDHANTPQMIHYYENTLNYLGGQPVSPLNDRSNLHYAPESGEFIEKTITISTGANGDTTQWEPGWGNWYVNDLLFGVSGYSNAQYASTIRFPNVIIPRGSFIISAQVAFTAEESWNAPYPIMVYFNNVDNAVAPTGFSDAETKLTALTTGVPWTPGNWVAESSYVSADFSSALQQIINRPGFVSGNAIMAVIYGTIGVPPYTYN